MPPEARADTWHCVCSPDPEIVHYGEKVMSRICFAILLAVTVAAPLSAAEPEPAEVKASLDKAVAFLKTRQDDDGSFASKLGGPGITALIVGGLVRSGYSPDDPMIAKAMAYLEKFVQNDGGIYN